MKFFKSVFRPHRQFHGVLYDNYLANMLIGIAGIVTIFSMPLSILFLSSFAPTESLPILLMLVTIVVFIGSTWIIRAISDHTGLFYTRVDIVVTPLPDGRTLREWKLYDTKEQLYYHEERVLPKVEPDVG